MKRGTLSAVATLLILVASASIADAQIIITYQRRDRNSSFTATFVGGYSYGYGYGYGGYGYGYGAGLYGAGYGYYSGYVTPYGPYNFSPLSWYGPSVPYGYFGYPGYMPPFNYGGGYVAPAPYPSAAGTASRERLDRMLTQKTIEDGFNRFRVGDYRGALAFFKEAVAGDVDNPYAPLGMALALAGTGDLKNADKALRIAFAALQPEDALKLDLPKLFKDAKEQARFLAAVKKSGDGKLTLGVLSYLLGDKAGAKASLQEAEKDDVVKKLLDRLSK